jgi:hypothetical protein
LIVTIMSINEMSEPKYHHASQKLYEAVLALVGDGSLNMRLTSAALPLLILRSQPGGQLPPDLKVRLDVVVEKLTKEPLSDEWRYLPRRMRGKNASDAAREIVSIFVAVMGGL